MLLSLPIHVALLISAIVVMVRRRKTFLPFPIFNMIVLKTIQDRLRTTHRQRENS